ncbi:hypothetical protein U1Q18_035388 [Sarracenia purpurea var. burkii]
MNDAVKTMEIPLGFPLNEGSKEVSSAKITDPMVISKNQGAKEHGQLTGKSKGRESLPSSRVGSGPVLSKGFAANHTAITACRKGEIS